MGAGEAEGGFVGDLPETEEREGCAAGALSGSGGFAASTSNCLEALAREKERRENICVPYVKVYILALFQIVLA